jgi:hypothetical protein
MDSSIPNLLSFYPGFTLRAPFMALNGEELSMGTFDKIDF